MSNISKLRDTADSLLGQQKYDEANFIYEEINRQVWYAIGTVQQGLNDFSRSYLTYNIMSGIEFKNNYTGRAATSLFIKWFNLDSDQVLNEFIFSLNGHLKCVTNSKILLEKYSSIVTLTKFLTLYNLIMYNTDDRWVNQILKYSTPIIENNYLTKIRPNIQMPRLSSMLTKKATELLNTDWKHVNYLILDYLKNKGENTTKLYQDIRIISGSEYKQSKSEYSKYEKYERYEKYEKYERYERYESNSDSSNKEKSNRFNSKNASEAQKSKYYGSILELKGVVTKKQIREKYLQLISKYHPDKVHSLGDDLKQVAEEKSKQINEAYEWLKSKYGI